MKLCKYCSGSGEDYEPGKRCRFCQGTGAADAAMQNKEKEADEWYERWKMERELSNEY